MKPNLTLMALVIVAALILVVAPAGAQGRGNEGQRRGGARASQGAPAPRQDRAQRAVPRSSVNRQPSARQAAPRGNENRQPFAPQVAPRPSDGRQSSARQAAPRGFQPPGNRPDDRRAYAPPRGGFGGYHSRPYARPYGFQPYRPFHFSRPYYSFRPRLTIGFGLWIGFSVPYPWSYFGDYRPRVYGYYPGRYYNPSLGARDYGGLSFDIQPSDADLYVDGEYVGMVGTFTPYGEPLTLMPGMHRIAIVRDRFRTMEWDVRVEPGQVIPYRGVMEPW